MLDKFKSIELDKPEPKKDEPKVDKLSNDMITVVAYDDSLRFEVEDDIAQQLGLFSMVHPRPTTEELLDHCDTILHGFGVINSSLETLDYVMVENGQLNKSLLDLSDNCLWFVLQAYNVLMLNGYHISGINAIDKTKRIINAIASIKNDIMKGNVNNQYDIEFILLVLYLDFCNYGDFIGM